MVNFSKWQAKAAAVVLAACVTYAAAQQESSVNFATQSINTQATATISRGTGSVGGSVASVVSTEAPSSTSTPPPPTATTSQSVASVPFYNVSSAAASASSSLANRTASSNYTLPSATATATWNSAALTVQSSVPYVMPKIDAANLPTMRWSLANESRAYRESLCARQTAWCATAGCVNQGAKVKENFCNVENLGSRCTCDKGSSYLEQYKWPVQFADCQGRTTQCRYLCMKPNATSAVRNACMSACSESFAQTCGLPGQFSADYAVNKPGQQPKLGMIQGGDAGSGALASVHAASSLLTLAVAAIVASALVA